MVCQSAGWDWLEISPLDVHIDLEREKKTHKNSFKQMAAVMSSLWQAIMRQRQQLGKKATVTEVRTETTALPRSVLRKRHHGEQLTSSFLRRRDVLLTATSQFAAAPVRSGKLAYSTAEAAPSLLFTENAAFFG